MLAALVVALRSLALICGGHRAVALENLALRQQLAVFKRTVKRPQLRHRDRLFWMLLANVWRDWRTALRSPSSPWQNPYAERLIGSIRHDCLNHVEVFGEQHLRRVLTGYVAYYHGSRTHLSLGKDVPTPRRVQGVTEGDVTAFREVGGLHHRSERRAA